MFNENEDFDFKPITEGLGFHKKELELREDVHPLIQNISPSSILPKPKLWGRNPLLEQNIPAPAPVRREPPVMHPPLSQPAMGWKPAIENVDFTDQPSQTNKPALTSFTVGFFDGAMVLGISLIFTAIVFAITGIEFTGLYESVNNTLGGFMAIGLLVFAVFEIYAVTCRSFFGRTLGEWAFGYRMGRPEQQGEITYPLKVAWRVFLHFITGFILLPAVSAALGFDLAGELSGVSVYADRS